MLESSRGAASCSSHEGSRLATSASQNTTTSARAALTPTRKARPLRRRVVLRLRAWRDRHDRRAPPFPRHAAPGEGKRERAGAEEDHAADDAADGPVAGLPVDALAEGVDSLPQLGRRGAEPGSNLL